MTIPCSEINLQSKHDLICSGSESESYNDDVMVLIWSFLPNVYGHERFETFEINTGTFTIKFFCLQAVVVDSLTSDTKLTTTTHELFKPLIAPSLVVKSSIAPWNFLPDM